MKLLIITSATVRGGAEEYVLTIAAAAIEAGWHTHVALPYADSNASLRQALEANHASCHPLAIAEPSSRGVQAMASAFLRSVRTRALLLAIKPDVVLINLPWADHCLGSIVACGWLQIPTAVMFHLIPPEGIPLSRSRRHAYTWARARRQQWLTNAQANRPLLANLFQMPTSDLLCIYNGIQLPTLLDRNSEAIAALRQQVRQELGIPATSKLLLTVGRLTPQKGYEDLLEVIPALLESDPDLRFVWAGDGEQRQGLCDRLYRAGIADKVLLIGHRSDLPRLLQSADLFVFPTRFEGHPFALLEAMAYGLPIVTTNVSSIPEVMTHQVHGLLCPSGDREALLHSIEWALQHPNEMQAMAQQAQQQAQHFSQASMIEKTFSVLQTLSLPTQSSSHSSTIAGVTH
ncbi:glycosyltransferase family 4 protein [Leptolyngbya sp. FACHB-321]|uniref:glycosyltransferase family 4 protein n=1 Tax=Leptolyngbya sp. FACHB-321 TaxID=2692807 RepID=UPI001685BA23|nr:glycosyltransferase family 4 protein [Leptolyngbya sp. FACHB-321]MBD2036624.1 glycosyltransferase family 4 protein [Leptolyngbya sp. FACHB-321]